MNKKLSFCSYRNIHDIKQYWIELDRKAIEIDCRYICYTYYQTYEWNEFLYNYISKGLNTLTATINYDLVLLDDKPFAIIPMVVTRLSKKARIPSCRVAGVLNMACPYVDDCSDEIKSAIVRWFIDKHRGIKLSFADIPEITPLGKIVEMFGVDVKDRTSYHVPLSQFATHDEYVSSLHKNIYKNIRKAYNHLKTDGKDIELKHFDKHNMPARNYMYALWKLYFKRKMAWRHKRISMLSTVVNSLKSVMETTFGCATQSLKKLDATEIYVLEIDHAPAAFMIVYRHRRHLLMPKLAIDTVYSRYSPGILLILEATKEWMSEGIVDFDMCRGDERYKKEMGGVNEPLCRIDKRLK